jgi:hypothetical protein
MQQMMRVFGTESGEDNAARIGLAVSVGVLEMQQLGAIHNVGPTVPRDHSGWNQQSIRKDRGLISLAIMIRIFEDQYFVVRSFAGLDMGVDLTAGNP